MDLFGSTELVYVLHKVPVVPDVSELVMDQHFKQPAVIWRRKMIAKMMNVFMQCFA